MIQRIVARIWSVWIGIVIVAIGCDQRVVEVSREAADRQAEQNQVMARLQQQIAEGTHDLVEADSVARRDFVSVHQDLLTERQRLDRSWAALEAERRSMAQERRVESFFASFVPIFNGTLLLAVLLLFLRQMLQRSAATESVEADLNELLLEQFFLRSSAAAESECPSATPTAAPMLPRDEEAS